jgi:hypothetical protein
LEDHKKMEGEEDTEDGQDDDNSLEEDS